MRTCLVTSGRFKEFCRPIDRRAEARTQSRQSGLTGAKSATLRFIKRQLSAGRITQETAKAQRRAVVNWRVLKGT